MLCVTHSVTISSLPYRFFLCIRSRLILHANQATWIKLDLHVCVYVETYMNVHFRDVTSLIVIPSQLGSQTIQFRILGMELNLS